MDLVKDRSLLLARFLFDKAERFLEQPDSYSHGLAISLSQDAIESILRVIAKELGARIREKASFFDIWNAVEKCAKREIPFSATIQEVNSARIGFKHHGNLPDQDTALRLVGYARQFLTEASREFLQIDWDRISLADTLKNERVREHIKHAEQSLKTLDIETCLQKCALARHEIGEALRAHLPELPNGLGYATGTPLDQTIDALGALISNLSTHLASATLGLTPRDVSRFSMLVPTALVSPLNKESAQFVSKLRVRPTLEDARFCVKHVSEMAVRFEQCWL